MADLKVKFGGDATELNAEIVKIQNQLRQFEAQLKKSTNTIEIKMLQDEMKKLSDRSDELNQQMSKVDGTSNKTTNALTNLSRIAQDSGSGFIGIANNLNPMLESFQRLQKETGSTGNALKSMVQGLVGPAGIGVAVGVATALLYKFGDRLFAQTEEQKKAAEKTKEHTDAIKAQKEAIEQIYTTTAQETVQITSLIAVLDNESESRHRKIKALEELKKINPEIFGALVLEKNEVNGLTQAYDKYLGSLTAVIALNIKRNELESLIKEQLKNAPAYLTDEEKAFNKGAKAKLDSLKSEDQLRQENIKSAVKDADATKIKNENLDKQKRLLLEITDLSKGVKISGEGNGGAEKLNDVQKALKDLQETLKSNEFQLLNGMIAEKGDKDSYAVKSLEAIYGTIKKIAGNDTKEALEAVKMLLSQAHELENTYYGGQPRGGAFSDQNVTRDKKDVTGVLTKEKVADAGALARNLININKMVAESDEKGVERRLQLYDKFAQFMANEVVGAISSVYDAMKNGENVIEALGNAFLKLAENIAMAIIQEEILASFRTAMGIGTTVATGGLGGSVGILSMLGSLFSGAHAEGGVTTGPSLGLIGEAGPEAIVPLSKMGSMLKSTFNAGAMSGGSAGGGGQFVLRGQDLLVAINRTQKSSNLKGQTISLA